MIRNSRFAASLTAFVMLAALMFGFALDTNAQTRRRTRTRPRARAGARRTTGRRTTTAARPATPVYTVASNTKVRVRLEQDLNSKTSKVGDTFNTTTAEPIYAGNGAVVIPQGSTIIGRVTSVTPARKGGNTGAIDVSFTEVKLPNGKTHAISGSLTDLNEGKTKSDNEGTAGVDKTKNRKIIFIGGGGVGGAVLGGAVGGGKGALIGAIIGGVGGAIAENQTKGRDAEVKSGTEFGVILNQPVSMPKYVEPQQ